MNGLVKGIHITSLKFNVKGGDGTGGLNGIDEFMSIHSWEKKDYEDAFDSNFKEKSEWKAILRDTEKDGTETDYRVFDDNATPQVADSEMEGVTDAGRDTVGTDRKRWLRLLERKYYYAGGSA
eukprot:scaffold254206_cov43-Attheya_sp.AAC.1